MAEINPNIPGADQFSIGASSVLSNASNAANSSYVSRFPRYGYDINFSELRAEITVIWATSGGALIASGKLSDYPSILLEIVTWNSNANTVTIRAKSGSKYSSSITIAYVKPTPGSFDNIGNMDAGRYIKINEAAIGEELSGSISGYSTTNIGMTYQGIATNPAVYVKASDVYRETALVWTPTKCTLENYLNNQWPTYTCEYKNNWGGTLGVKTGSFSAYSIKQAGSLSLRIYKGTKNMTDGTEEPAYVWDNDTTDYDTSDVSLKLYYKNGGDEDEAVVEGTITHDAIDTTRDAVYYVRGTYNGGDKTYQISGIRNFEASYKFSGGPVSISGDVDVSYSSGESASNTFYNSAASYWKIPSGVTLTANLTNDGTDSIDLSDAQFFDGERQLVVDSPHGLSDGYNTITAKGETETYGLPYEASITVYVETDYVDSISVTPNTNTLTLSKKTQSYKNDITVVVTYASGLKLTDPLYTLNEGSDAYILSDSAKLTVSFGKDQNGNAFSYEYSPTWKEPTVSSDEILLKNSPTLFMNEASYIDYSRVAIKVVYSTGYQEELTNLTFSCNITLDTTQQGAFHFDGTQKIYVDMGSATKKDAAITASKTPRFGSTITKTIPISIYEITKIVGLSFVSGKLPFTDYYIGDRFIDSEPDDQLTEVMIYYPDVANPDQNLTLPTTLKGGLLAVSTDPVRGTPLTKTTDKMEVTIYAATDSNVKLTYTISVSPKMIYGEEPPIKLKGYKLKNAVTYENEAGEMKTLSAGTYVLLKRAFVEAGVIPSFSQLTKKTDDNGFSHYYIDNGTSADRECFGFISKVYTPETYAEAEESGQVNDTLNSRVILFQDYIPPVTGQSNIVVEFPVYQTYTVHNADGSDEVHPVSDYINLCTIGHLFGNNNAKNRLFVSGNPDFGNMDWHSGQINESKNSSAIIASHGDFSYFEDTSWCQYGQSDNKIVGYDIISNDRMVVFKSQSAIEATVYYRTNGLIQATDGAGSVNYGVNNQVLYEESFPRVIGNNSGVGALRQSAIANFNGDTVFLSSDKHVDGLDLYGMIGDAQRYASSRSLFIDPKLKTADLTDAFLWTDNEYMFLVLKDEVFATNYKTVNEAKQYDWYRLNYKGVTAICRDGNSVYFAGDDGLCVMANGSWMDCRKTFINAASLATMDPNANTMQISASKMLPLQESYEAGKTKLYYHPILDSDTDYGEAADDTDAFEMIGVIRNEEIANTDILNNGNGTFTIVALDENGEFDQERHDQIEAIIKDGATYYINHADKDTWIKFAGKTPSENSDLSVSVYWEPVVAEYILGSTFQLVSQKTEVNNAIALIETGALNRKLRGEYEMRDIDFENGKFSLYDKDASRAIDLTEYGEDQATASNFSGEIREYENVGAYYITAPFTMGDLSHNKTIWGWTLSADSNTTSEIEIAVATNKADFDDLLEMSKLEGLGKNIAGGEQGYDYANQNPTQSGVTFDKHVVPKTVTFYRPYTAPFFCFALRNEDSTNAVLSTFQVTYSIGLYSFGEH